MASPPVASQAWTEETQVKEEDEEKKAFVRIIEKATSEKVKDLTKPPVNHVPYTSTAARSKKVIKMQNRFAKERPVPKGTKVPGMGDNQSQIPFFLPSEKPAASFMAQLNTDNRKAMSEYSKTLERKSKRPNLRRQHAFIKVKSKPDLTDESEYNENIKQQTTANIGSNFLADMLPVSSPLTNEIEDDFINNNFDPNDLLTKRNILLRKSQSMMASEKPSIKRSISSGTSFRESPMTPRNDQMNPHYHPLFSYNTISGSASRVNRRRTNHDVHNEVQSARANHSQHNTISEVQSARTNHYPRKTVNDIQSARSPNKFPVYDKSEIEQSLDEIDLLLPGVCISSPRRPTTVRPSTNMKPTRTPTCCSCCSLCDTPKYTLGHPSPFELQHPDLFPHNRSLQPNHCRYCQADDGKKLVQYAHGDVIKTFDWLSKNAKETPL